MSELVDATAVGHNWMVFKRGKVVAQTVTYEAARAADWLLDCGNVGCGELFMREPVPWAPATWRRGGSR